ncbi:hypothetical protein [Falsibacillus albus]|uniref:Uncharacterized protein n=1 Tax=Falsibacillus albus TaxID=2478915 RepID=A0A3L7JSE5_9BACI|nr:hypothetical protein [Falsibacillus albus]RLQ93778.1 hypothetical protein D9X91_16020 [Falsibacillus albus]
MKKRIWILSSTIVLLIIITLVMYRFFPWPPSAFPKESQLTKRMNGLTVTIQADKIQAIVELDATHKLVPFVSTKHTYGLSFWVWNKHEWELDSIDTEGSPRIWKMDNNDLAAQYIVWNLKPDDNLKTLDFYLMKDRGYMVSGGAETYMPKIQMKDTVKVHGQSFGIIKLPEEWVYIMKQTSRVSNRQQPDYFFETADPNIHIGWQSKDQNGNEYYPETPNHGYSYRIGNDDLEVMMPIDNTDLE